MKEMKKSLDEVKLRKKDKFLDNIERPGRSKLGCGDTVSTSDH